VIRGTQGFLFAQNWPCGVFPTALLAAGGIGLLDKLEDLRMAYKKATGKRFNEQDFMRMIVNRLDLQMLL